MNYLVINLTKFTSINKTQVSMQDLYTENTTTTTN